jgi:hypothetical protein
VDLVQIHLGMMHGVQLFVGNHLIGEKARRRHEFFAGFRIGFLGRCGHR